jgi:hypothetical protein
LAACRLENQALTARLTLGPPAAVESFNLPTNMPPTGYYVYRVQKEEREEFERLKVENAELRKRLGK